MYNCVNQGSTTIAVPAVPGQNVDMWTRQVHTNQIPVDCLCVFMITLWARVSRLLQRTQGYGNVTVGTVSVRPSDLVMPLCCAVWGEQVATGQACAGPVDYVLKRVRMLKHYGVKPWVVLDGRRTPMKV